MQNMWKETRTKIETVNWRGKPIVLENVRAIQNEKTGKIRVRPYDIARAEIASVAERYDIEPRDVATLTMIFAKPGNFKEGEVFYKYHLQKMLFYLWKELGNYGFYEAMPRDEFEPAKNGPVPEHIDEDLKRFIEKHWIEIKEEMWHPEYGRPSMRILLTAEGEHVVKQLWEEVPVDYRKITISVKNRIHPLEPEKVRHLVHMEYPEYRDTYVENDIE